MSNVDHLARDTAKRDVPLTFGYYVRLLARRWWIPVSLALLGACLSLVYTGLQDTTYRSRATVVLSPLDPAVADELTRLAPTVARLLRSDRVLLGGRRAYLAGSPDGDPAAAGPDDLRARTTVVVPRDTSLFQITADGSTQRDANALVRAVVASATRSISTLGPRTTAGGPTSRLGVHPFGPSVAVGQVSPTPTRNLIVGVNVGLLFGIVGALLLRDPRRARMRADDLAELLRASEVVYAPLPSPRPLRDRTVARALIPPPSDTRGEGIRLLGGRLWQWLQDDRRVVLLLGDLPPHRLRSVALALAAHLTRTGARPAVVEADFHGSGWSLARNGDRTEGLGNLLNGAEDDGGVAFNTASHDGDGAGRFTIVPRGEQPSDPALAFASSAYGTLVDSLRQRHDFVIVVGPAMEWQAEVAALAACADAVLLLLPPWIPYSRAAAITTVRSARTDASIVVSLFGDAEDVTLAASREV
jgi:Mrp family chromosome partitioning ATPase